MPSIAVSKMALSSRNSAFWRRSSFSRLSRLLPAPGRDGRRAAFGGAGSMGSLPWPAAPGLAWRLGARRKGSCLLPPVKNIEDRGRQTAAALLRHRCGGKEK